MIIPFPPEAEKYRMTAPAKMASKPGDDFGAFYVIRGSVELMIMACNEDEASGVFWEHVSARAREKNRERCPTWEEMCYIKSLFWGPEECVVQYHPPASEYKNDHPHVLHLWRYTKAEIPRPPRLLV
jgi:hypothetical protein